MSNDENQQQLALQATVQPVPTLGEGCLSRFDPESLNPEQGADFSAAEQLRRPLLKYKCAGFTAAFS